MSAIRAALVFACHALIRAYQWLIAPLIGPRCRFAPSCSEYAFEAIALHGPATGFYLALRRVLRCHPWGGHGYDPVPERKPDVHPACRHEAG